MELIAWLNKQWSIECPSNQAFKSHSARLPSAAELEAQTITLPAYTTIQVDRVRFADVGPRRLYKLYCTTKPRLVAGTTTLIAVQLLANFMHLTEFPTSSWGMEFREKWPWINMPNFLNNGTDGLVTINAEKLLCIRFPENRRQLAVKIVDSLEASPRQPLVVLHRKDHENRTEHKIGILRVGLTGLEVQITYFLTGRISPQALARRILGPVFKVMEPEYAIPHTWSEAGGEFTIRLEPT